MPELWFIYALAAAILWGIDYAVWGKLLVAISPWTLLVYNGIFSIAIGLFVGRANLFAETRLVVVDWKMTLGVATILITGLSAGILTSFSIMEKNASLASLIEISYPFFVMVFSYLLFGEYKFSLYDILGGVFIISGVALIYANNS